MRLNLRVIAWITCVVVPSSAIADTIIRCPDILPLAHQPPVQLPGFTSSWTTTLAGRRGDRQD
jgi:hypothetical protein